MLRETRKLLKGFSTDISEDQFQFSWIIGENQAYTTFEGRGDRRYRVTVNAAGGYEVLRIGKDLTVAVDRAPEKPPTGLSSHQYKLDVDLVKKLFVSLKEIQIKHYADDVDFIIM